MTQIVTSDGGPHPASTWATIIADRIVDTSAVSDDRAIAAHGLKIAVAESLLPLLSEIQGDERMKLYSDGATVLSALDPIPYLNEIVLMVRAAADNTLWATHFAKDDVTQAMREIAAPLVATMLHIERLWWCDANPQSPHAVAYKARYSR